MTKTRLYAAAFVLATTFASCVTDDEPEIIIARPYEITISNITNIPEGVTFDKVRAEVSGVDWKTIAAVEAAYIGGKIVLTLPIDIPDEDLQQSIRSQATDIYGYWWAKSDNGNAKVAGLRDIIAYNGDQRVGRLQLTNWTGGGSATGISYIYYHYANEPFTLSGTYMTYTFQASFATGWNAYANTNLSEESGQGAVLCTTTIPENAGLVWRFESWVY